MRNRDRNLDLTKSIHILFLPSRSPSGGVGQVFVDLGLRASPDSPPPKHRSHLSMPGADIWTLGRQRCSILFCYKHYITDLSSGPPHSPPLLFRLEQLSRPSSVSGKVRPTWLESRNTRRNMSSQTKTSKEKKQPSPPKPSARYDSTDTAASRSFGLTLPNVVSYWFLRRIRYYSFIESERRHHFRPHTSFRVGIYPLSKTARYPVQRTQQGMKTARSIGSERSENVSRRAGFCWQRRREVPMIYCNSVTKTGSEVVMLYMRMLLASGSGSIRKADPLILVGALL